MLVNVSIFLFVALLFQLNWTLGKASCNLKNLFSLKQEDTIEEKDIPFDYTEVLYLSTCRDAIFTERIYEIPREISSWSISKKGVLVIKLKPYKYGVITIPYTIEDPTDGTVHVNVEFTLTVRNHPNAPLLFVAQNGVKLDSDASRIRMKVEQDRFGFEIQIGGYSYDLDETLTFSISKESKHGHVVVSNATTATHYPYGNDTICPFPKLQTNSSEVDHNETTEDLPYYPCGLKLLYPGEELRWISVLLTYSPRQHFFGRDTFSATVAVSNSQTATVAIDVVVLANPCHNNGWCVGTPKDPDCTSLLRATGFSYLNYTCGCHSDWEGPFCRLMVDYCFSAPCPEPYLCRPLVGSFQCHCPSNRLHCSLILRSWQTALIILSICVILTTTAVLIILTICRNGSTSTNPIQILRIENISAYHSEDKVINAS